MKPKDRLQLPGVRRAVAEVARAAAPSAARGTRWSRSAPCRSTAGAGAAAASAGARYSLAATAGPRLYEEIDTVVSARLTTGIDEFDRVLGGGVVPGSLVLIGGEPGIGKSTLLLQAAAHFANTIGPVLYSSGEESEHQIKSRGERLGIERAPLYLLAETCLERILEEIARLRPALVIVDSIQTVFSLKFQSAPGSIGQVREAATQLLFAAKGQNIPTFLVGHVTKDGSLAGPKVLEHIVDTVLYFEGRKAPLASRRPRGEEPLRRGERARRVRDDRQGPQGRAESLGALSRRAARRTSPAPRCCAAWKARGRCWSKCRRSSARAPTATRKRMASGIDQNRLSLLLAVLEKRAGLNLLGEDVFVNVAGGMTVDEPAADLAIVAAVASSLRNRPIRQGTAVFGEVGLAGEVRGAPQAALRVREAAQMGFTRVRRPATATSRRDEAPRRLRARAGAQRRRSARSVDGLVVGGARRDSRGEASAWPSTRSPIPDPRSPIPDPRSPIPDPRSPIPDPDP